MHYGNNCSDAPGYSWDGESRTWECRECHYSTHELAAWENCGLGHHFWQLLDPIAWQINRRGRRTGQGSCLKVCRVCKIYMLQSVDRTQMRRR